jgi:predicted small secreted protein
LAVSPGLRLVLRKYFSLFSSFCWSSHWLQEHFAEGHQEYNEGGGQMKLLIRTILLITLTFSIGAVSVGCNTMEGVGKDVQKGGEKIEDAAE